MADVSDALREVVETYERTGHPIGATQLIIEHGAALAQALENDARWRSFRRTISIHADDMTPERWDMREDSFMADYADAYDPDAIAAQQKEAANAR